MTEKAWNKDQIEKEIQKLDGWQLRDGKIQKDFEFKDFKHALGFMVQIGFQAEKYSHHPEWFNVYNKVSIQLQTHDAGGITSKDFQLAQDCDKISRHFAHP